MSIITALIADKKDLRNLKIAFESYDNNKDGYLDLEELKAVKKDNNF